MIATKLIKKQRETLRGVNNYRFTIKGNEFRIKYEGGIAEYVSVTGRPDRKHNFKHVVGFHAYKLYDREQVIEKAKDLASQMVKD